VEAVAHAGRWCVGGSPRTGGRTVNRRAVPRSIHPARASRKAATTHDWVLADQVQWLTSATHEDFGGSAEKPGGSGVPSARVELLGLQCSVGALLRGSSELINKQKSIQHTRECASLRSAACCYCYLQWTVGCSEQGAPNS
jgi:hypothetical protein